MNKTKPISLSIHPLSIGERFQEFYPHIDYFLAIVHTDRDILSVLIIDERPRVISFVTLLEKYPI